MNLQLKASLRLDEQLLCLATYEDRIYTGGTNRKLHVFSTDLEYQKELCEHEKSLRCLDVKDKMVICGSYDGNATLIHNDEIFETIEGPETEIKGVFLANGNTIENKIGICSRGKTAWVLDLNEKIEIESVLEDHTQDIKGIKFIDDQVYTFGYDCTVNIYSEFTQHDDSWVLDQKLDDMSSTIWDILIFGDILYAACNDGHITMYRKDERLWKFEKIVKMTDFPIYTICLVGDMIAIPLDLYDIGLFDLDFNLLCYHKVSGVKSSEKSNQKDLSSSDQENSFKDEKYDENTSEKSQNLSETGDPTDDEIFGEINCIRYNEKHDLLITCDDLGHLKSYVLNKK